MVKLLVAYLHKTTKYQKLTQKNDTLEEIKKLICTLTDYMITYALQN